MPAFAAVARVKYRAVLSAHVHPGRVTRIGSGEFAWLRAISGFPARSGGGPYDDRGRRSALRSRTEIAAAPPSEVNQQILVGGRNLHMRVALLVLLVRGHTFRR